MLCGAPYGASELKLPPAAELAYLGRTGCLVSPGWDDGAELALCEQALVHIGLPKTLHYDLFKILGALLLLGQIDFGDAETAAIVNSDVLATLCSLIEVDAEHMGRGLTIKMTKAGSEWIENPNTPAKASEMRHGLARAMYAATFDWLVLQINHSLKIGGDQFGGEANADHFIGILDIFGFETFQTNSLEQLCINFCNERLQATFNEAVFAAVQEENLAEGITLPDADLADIDNTAVVKLIGGRRRSSSA